MAPYVSVLETPPLSLARPFMQTCAAAVAPEKSNVFFFSLEKAAPPEAACLSPSSLSQPQPADSAQALEKPLMPGLCHTPPKSVIHWDPHADAVLPNT